MIRGRRGAGMLALVLLLSWMSLGHAQLDADPAGGPLTLPDDVAAAFASWQGAFGAEELEEPNARVTYAPNLLGPHTLSLTLRWEDGATEVLLDPAGYATGPVLLHEMGVLLGVPAGGTGVMNPAIGVAPSGEAPSDAMALDAPTAEDLALLRDLRAYPPADLTRDGAVDFYDLAAFGAAYGSVGVNLRADLDGDGRVGEADLAILREAYAFAAPAQSTPPAQNLAPAPIVSQEPAEDLGAEPGTEPDGGGADPELEVPTGEGADEAAGDDGADDGSDGSGNGADEDAAGGDGP